MQNWKTFHENIAEHEGKQEESDGYETVQQAPQNVNRWLW
jgi:hypothetical protein